MPLGKKGRYGVVRGEAEAIFSPYHLFLESSNAEDFADDRILQQVLCRVYTPFCQISAANSLD